MITDMMEIAVHNGEFGSMVMLAEEASELAQAAAKYIRAMNVGAPATDKKPEDIQSNLAEEMADVLICGFQACFMADVSLSDVIRWMEYKIDRRKKSIELEKRLATINEVWKEKK